MFLFPHHYLLKIFVDSGDVDLLNLYKTSIVKHNKRVKDYFVSIENGEKNILCFDAGFDLFCPEKITVLGKQTLQINHNVKTSMDFINSDGSQLLEARPVGYYLYPRSSTGLKTPLRLANSVGIIDSGYRGNIIAVFDNWIASDFAVDQYQRLVQLCPPNLSYPIYIRFVELEEDLGLTIRGNNGFGSSGK
jgi:dUTP pyrophosphatase